jgi:hypothetical protein
MKKRFIFLCKSICLLVFICDSTFSQIVIDTLHQYPDTAKFFERSNGPWTDDISNLAVKIILPDTNNYQIKSLQVLISSKIDTLHHSNFPIRISVGDFPEQNILIEKYVQPSTYYPFWQKIDFENPIMLQGYKYFYVSGSLMFLLSTSSISGSLYTNNYRYNEGHLIWQEGTYIYFPIQAIVKKVLSDIDEKNSKVNILQFQLYQNYPNPFNPTTIISYQIINDGLVTIKVFDVLGREIRTLVNGYKVQGTYSVSFDASKLASGIYFYQLRSGNFISTKKMLLLK